MIALDALYIIGAFLWFLFVFGVMQKTSLLIGNIVTWNRERKSPARRETYQEKYQRQMAEYAARNGATVAELEERQHPSELYWHG